jgi:hypothetical protein
MIGAVGRYVYNVRQGSNKGPQIGTYQHEGQADSLRDGALIELYGIWWRIIDRQRTDVFENDGNILVVERYKP